MTLADLVKVLAPLRTRIANTITRAIVRGVDDAKKFQALQVEMLADEPRDEVERIENYGFTSHPKTGAEAVAVCEGGRRDQAVVIAVGDRRYRIRNLESGEVCVYNDTGAKIVMKASGDIEATPASGKALVLTGNMTISGTLDVTGAATMGATLDVTGVLTGSTINGSEISDGGKILGTHTHSVPGSGLSAPAGGGTVTGSATSAAPS